MIQRTVEEEDPRATVPPVCMADAIGPGVLSSSGKIGDQRKQIFLSQILLAPRGALLGNADFNFQGCNTGTGYCGCPRLALAHPPVAFQQSQGVSII